MKTLKDAFEAMQTIWDFCVDHQCSDCGLFALCVKYLKARDDTILPTEWFLGMEDDNERDN